MMSLRLEETSMVRVPEPRRLRGDNARAAGDVGYVLAMTALLLLPILVVTAFATDLGAWYAQATRMQRAADAAALAGVVWASDPVKWDTEARATATQNGYTNGVNGVTVSVARISSQRIQFIGYAVLLEACLLRSDAYSARYGRVCVPCAAGKPDQLSRHRHHESNDRANESLAICQRILHTQGSR